MSSLTTNLGLFKYDTTTDGNTPFNITQALNNNWDILDHSAIKGNIITWDSASGTFELISNRIHKITCSGNVTFSLPTTVETNYFNQMLVELYMPSVYTINLGTSVYFNSTTPSMSSIGYYTLIYEYDNIRQNWVVGVLKKG